MSDSPMPPADAPLEPNVESTSEPTIEPAVEPTVAAPATATEAPTIRRGPQGGWWWGTGRRKAAVARVRVRPGQPRMIVNGRPMEEFFRLERDRNDINAVLDRTKMASGVEIAVKVGGGGTTGQAGAIILGLARALNNYDASLEPILRDNGFLSRDPRKVERKKYGQRGARRRFQFSKR